MKTTIKCFIHNLKEGIVFKYQNELMVILLIISVNIIFKSIYLSDPGLWYDECFSVFHSQKNFNAIIDVSKWDIVPPLYYIVLSWWMKLFGMSEYSVRFFSVLCSSLAAGTLFFFCRRSFNITIAILTSILFIVSNELYFYAHEARGYSLIILLSIISSFIYFSLIEKPSVIKFIVLGLVNYFLFYIHYLTGIIVLWQFLASFYYFRKKGFYFYQASHIVFILILIPWMKRLSEIFFKDTDGFWLPAPSKDDLYKVFFDFANGKTLAIIYLLIIIICIIYYFIQKKHKIENHYKFKLFYFIFLGFGSILAIFFLSSITPMFSKRYILFSLPAIYIVISYLISVLQISSFIKYSVIIIIALLSLFNIKYYPSKGMEYKEALPVIQGLKDENTLVVMQTRDMNALFSYYYDKNIFRQFNDLDNSLKKENIVMFNDSSQIGNFNFLPFDRIILTRTFQELADPTNTLLTYFKKNYKLIKEYNNFQGININVFEENYDFFSYKSDTVINIFPTTEFSNLSDEIILSGNYEEYRFKIRYEVLVPDTNSILFPLLVTEIKDMAGNTIYWKGDILIDTKKVDFKPGIWSSEVKVNNVSIKNLKEMKEMKILFYFWNRNNKKYEMKYKYVSIHISVFKR